MNGFQWMNKTLLYKNISLILFSKRAHSLLLDEIDGEIYTQRGHIFLSHIFFREPECANACTSLRAMSSERSETALIGCVSLARLPILCTLSKSDRVVITWSPSGYTPVGSDCPEALSPPCLLITTWPLVKVHGVTKNEPKIHVICYKTIVSEALIILEKMF